MRLVLSLIAGLLVLATAPAAGAAIATSSSSVSSVASAPRLAAKLVSCGSGTSAAGRSAVFSGSMPRRTGASRLWMRFDLERRDALTGRWTRVRAPTFARWEKSRPGVRGFVYTKRVEGLSAPATYRVVVRFRWRTVAGRTVRKATRTSRACRQADPRPDLRVTAATISPDRGSLAVTVTNRGRSRTAVPTVLTVRLGATAVGYAAVPVLAAGDATSVTLAVPPCGEAGAYSVLVDAADAVEEADEDDNEQMVTCFA